MRTAADRYDDAIRSAEAKYGAKPERIHPLLRSLERAELIAVIEAAVAEERARCAAIARESARLGDEDGNPDVVAAARIIARKIERGD